MEGGCQVVPVWARSSAQRYEGRHLCVWWVFAQRFRVSKLVEAYNMAELANKTGVAPPTGKERPGLGLVQQ